MSADRAALIEHAASTIAAGSKSFAAASRLFPPEIRIRAQLLYAWCRACDDRIDGQVMGHGMRQIDDSMARLAELRRLTAQALAGESTGQPDFECLRLLAAEVALPPRYPHDLIEGFALDAAGWCPSSEDDLYRYCYHVAGTVGCMMAIVMGVDPDDESLLDRACDLGMAFQLANIARDIGEDAAAGRCYLPHDWLAEACVERPAHLLLDRAGLTAIARKLAAAARAYQVSAQAGARRLPYRSRWAVLAAAGIYGGIARKVARRGQAAITERVTTSKMEKLGCIAASAIAAALPAWAPEPHRINLWTRSRPEGASAPPLAQSILPSAPGVRAQ